MILNIKGGTYIIIPAPRVGTRFLLATNEWPKEMMLTIGKSVIQYTVEEEVASGIEDRFNIASELE